MSQSALCANGCNKPVKMPSRVLCAKCLDALNEKMHRILSLKEPTT